jgi:hypothetical protein
VALVATVGADSFADRQLFRGRPIRSAAEATSLVCINNERITALLVVQVTLLAEIIQGQWRNLGQGMTYSAQSITDRFTG